MCEGEDRAAGGVGRQPQELTLALATPDTQDEGHLDLGQVQEVLGHVDGKLVQEGGGDVVAVLDVAEAASCRQQRKERAGKVWLCLFQIRE